MRMVTFLLLMVMISYAEGALLLGGECPSPVYVYEMVNCTFFLSSTEESEEVTPIFHGAKGIFIVLNAPQSVTVSPFYVERIDVTVWSWKTGRDAIVMDITSPVKGGYLTPIESTPSPLEIGVNAPPLEAGRTNNIEVVLKGSGQNIRVWLELPQTFSVSGEETLSHLEGTASFTFEVTPSPYAWGIYDGYVYVSFEDEKGEHVLRYPFKVQISIPVWVWGIVVGLLLAIILYLYWKVKKKPPETPNEAQ